MAVSIGPFKRITAVNWGDETAPTDTTENPYYIVVYFNYVYYGIGNSRYPCRTDPPPSTNIFDALPFTNEFNLLPSRYAQDTGLMEAYSSGSATVTSVPLSNLAVTGFPALMPAPIAAPSPYAWYIVPNIDSYGNTTGLELNTQQRLSAASLATPIGQPQGMTYYYDKETTVEYKLFDINWTGDAYCNEWGWIWRNYTSGLGPLIATTLVDFSNIELTYLPTGETYTACATSVGLGATGVTPVLCRRNVAPVV